MAVDMYPRARRLSVVSTRSGALFNAHSYPTKINVEAAMACISEHTSPGDLVFDGFSGSGSTGLAATMLGNEDHLFRLRVEDRVGPLDWGPRDAILYDVSELAAFISGNLLDPPSPDLFLTEARRLLEQMRTEWSWLYRAVDEEGGQGFIRHTIWSELVVCPSCETPSSVWEAAVTTSPPEIRRSAHCPKCGSAFTLKDASRLLETYWDDLLDKQIEQRVRVPVSVYGATGSRLWARPANDSDRSILQEIARSPTPAGVPVQPMALDGRHRWGQLYRAGYHQGISHVHHFYTKRNLIALSAAYSAANEVSESVREAMRFWISSYNATHSTIMTRVVCKRDAKDFVVTSAQPGTLYISSLPVEKNVFEGLDRKLNTIAEAFRLVSGRRNKVTVRCESSTDVALPPNSVDYVFTDPPFGDNIQYSEVNRINEAWLGRLTDPRDEAIVSTHQGKSSAEYERLLTLAFRESYRILKPGKHMTVAFHSTRAELWDCVTHALTTAGFVILEGSRLDKTQRSFKQTTTTGAVHQDALLLAQKPPTVATDTASASTHADQQQPQLDPASVIDKLVAEAIRREDGSVDARSLFSEFAAQYVQHGLSVPVDAKTFFRLVEKVVENLTTDDDHRSEQWDH